MPGAIGFALDAARVIVPLALSDAFKPKIAAEAKSNVQIILENGDKTSTAGGPAPHVALWDDNGSRIGQWSPDDDNITAGDVKEITVKHSQTKPKYSQTDPYYVMVSQLSNNAICVSAITVSNSKISGAFYSDTGFKCGQTWFASSNRIGSNFQAPRCVWLDGNRDNGINARALSFHLNDMQPNDEKMKQYHDNPDTLCKSTLRYSYWGNLLPDGIPPFFSPPLKYKGNNGGDKDISKVLNDPKHPYDKGAYLHPGKTNAKARRRDGKVSRHSGNCNQSPLVVSDQGTDVKEICELETSSGWDIVSTNHKLFCDMDQKQFYPLCDKQISTKCFDLKNKTLVNGPHLDTRDEGVKKLRFRKLYNTTTH